MVYNTYCDIPQEDSVTKVYGSLHLGKLCRGREGVWAGKGLGERAGLYSSQEGGLYLPCSLVYFEQFHMV
jgi:hypothetical protein